MENNENNFYDMESLKRKETASEGNSGGSLFFCGIIVGLAAALLIVCVVYLSARLHGLWNVREHEDEQSVAEVTAEQDTLVDEGMMVKLKTIEAIIKQRYSLSEVTDEQLEEGIYRGMVWSLEDVYSDYYSAEELQKQMQQIEGIYYGIGVYVAMDTEKRLAKVTGIIAGTAAEEVGICEGDYIYAVEGNSVQGVSMNELVTMLKGEEGTKVNLTLLRGEEYIDVEVTRCRVESPTVVWEMLDEKTAYIQILEFDDVTIDQFAEALAMAKGSGMDGLILDLRGNPGGKMTAVTEIARMMLPEGLIVYTEDKNGNRREYTCDGTRKLEVPMVVLVDRKSASASEVLAGAIKDHKIGTLVGTTTFGKGIVQDVIPLKDGSAVKLTISSYFTPNGNNIHGIGIEPDVVCEFDGEAYYEAEVPVDNQLEKAKEVLNGMME